MTTAMCVLVVDELGVSSAEEVYRLHRFDTTLPSEAALDLLLATPGAIPADFRVFDLVFPRAVMPGLSECGGVKMTDDSISYVVWDDEKWEKRFMPAGRMGWGCSRPGRFGPRARLARFVS